MGAAGSIERISKRKLASCRENARRPRPGRRKFTDEGQRNIIAALKIINETLADCVALAQQVIRNDPALGGVPLHLRMEVARDFMDRGQMPRRTEARVEQQTALSWDEFPFADDFRLPRVPAGNGMPMDANVTAATMEHDGAG